MYNKRIMELFLNAKNAGEIRSADGASEVENETCGSIIKLFILAETGVVTEARFKTFGCPVSIAASVLITEMIKGKTIEEISIITLEDLLQELGELPQGKVRCVETAFEALIELLASYDKKQKRKEKIVEKS
ncbi:MAG: iron-sulfur cluster assembly scaffold protein [Clostridia bacterium]|nr:iron-sulfur cluster assembly scaffold protein [Clostridia bacterium]